MTTIRVALLLTAACAILCAPCPAAPPNPRPPLAWRYQTGAPITTALTADGSRIAMVTQRGRVTMLDRNGRRVFEVSITSSNPAPETISASPALLGNCLIAATRDGTLYAFDAATGKELWTSGGHGDIRNRPLLQPGPDGNASRVFVLSGMDGSIHCLDADDGKLLWESPGTARCDSPPTLGGNSIVFGSCDAAVHFVDAVTGQAKGSVTLCDECQMTAGVAIEGNHVFTGTRAGMVYCVEMTSQDPVWTNASSAAETFTTPALGPSELLIASADGHLYSLSKSDGSLRWKTPIGPSPQSPILAGDIVLVASEGRLYAVERESGKPLWELAVSDEITDPVLLDRLIVVGGGDGAVSAFSQENTRSNNHDRSAATPTSPESGGKLQP